MASDLKRTAERFHYDLIVDGNLDAADNLIDDNFKLHSTDYPPELLQGRDGVKMLAGGIKNAFPDIRISHDDLIAEGNKVVIR